MIKEKHKFFSNNLNKDVNIVVYGHFGSTILLFPTYTDSAEENEEQGLINSVENLVIKGKFRIISVDGCMLDSWLNNQLTPIQKSKRLYNYNNFLIDELVPIIFNITNGPSPIITAGANLGAFMAANTYFRRPDLFYGAIAMSGTFNIQHYTKDYFDDNCYYNSPIHYLPNLNESFWLSYLQSKHHIYLMSGSGENEFPENSLQLSNILSSKNIKHKLDIWSDEFGHNFETWKLMLNKVLDANI